MGNLCPKLSEQNQHNNAGIRNFFSFGHQPGNTVGNI